MVLVLSLEGAATEAEVLERIGQLLELGGPDGNVPVDAIQGRGWGLNWDALFDCLLEVENGGIWGKSQRLSFPLKLEIRAYQRFEFASPHGFETLEAVLRDAQTHYAKRGKQFTYDFG